MIKALLFGPEKVIKVVCATDSVGGRRPLPFWCNFMSHASLLQAMSCQSRLHLPEPSDNHPPRIVSQAAMDAMEPESEDSGSENSIDDAGDDAEMQMGEIALAVAPAKPFSAKPKIIKGKGNGKWQQQQQCKKEGAYDPGRLIPGWQTGRIWVGQSYP